MIRKRSKLGALIAEMAEHHHRSVSARKLSDTLADPHLARDIGLPHQPRAARPQRPLW